MTTTTKARPVYRELASAIIARRNCIESGNTQWRDRWTDRIEHIERDILPSGSGIDCGSKVDVDESDSRKIFIDLSFHHMDENGYYDGWTEHRITVSPSFDGIELKISGRDRNQIKDYLHDVYYHALTDVYIEED